MKARKTAVAIGAVVVVIIASVAAMRGCAYDADDMRSDLSAVRTPADEAAVFDNIWRRTTVQFALLDDSGTQLPEGYDPKWRDKAKQIRFHIDGESVIYTVVDPENILLLGRE